MSAIRVTGSILLAVAVLASALLAFIPAGSAWNEPENSSVRTTHTFYLFTKDVDNTPRGEAATGTDGATYRYFDESLTGTDGMRGLRAMGPLLAGGILITFVALLLTSLPGVRQTRTGGVFALLGVGLFSLAAVGGVMGMDQHATSELSRNTEVTFSMVAVGALALAILLTAIAMALGFARATPRTSTRAATRAAPSWDDAPSYDRRLRCPDCSTLVTAPAGLVPICPNCQFGSDYVGPAGQPVPGQPVAA